jgi:hypothetical protein
MAAGAGAQTAAGACSTTCSWTPQPAACRTTYSGCCSLLLGSMQVVQLSVSKNGRTCCCQLEAAEQHVFLTGYRSTLPQRRSGCSGCSGCRMLLNQSTGGNVIMMSSGAQSSVHCNQTAYFKTIGGIVTMLGQHDEHRALVTVTTPHQPGQ